jgi:hypothetical protein
MKEIRNLERYYEFSNKEEFDRFKEFIEKEGFRTSEKEARVIIGPNIIAFDSNIL